MSATERGLPTKTAICELPSTGVSMRPTSLLCSTWKVWPEHTVDHREPSDKGDNRWRNLRHATRSQQGQNRRAQRNGTTGFTGVCLRQSPSGTPFWYVQVSAHGKTYTRCCYGTLFEAAQVRDQIAKELQGEFFQPTAEGVLPAH
jgi:hypothetical protein